MSQRRRAVENEYGLVDDSPVPQPPTHHYHEIPPLGPGEATPSVTRPYPNTSQAGGPMPPHTHAARGNPPKTRGIPQPVPPQAGFGGQQQQQQPLVSVRELSALKLSVQEKEFQIQEMARDLENSHEEVTRLNKLMVEKKESAFKHHEAFTRLEDELVAARDELARVRAARQQAPSTAMREDNAHLQREISRLRKEVTELQWRNRQLQDQASNRPAVPQAPNGEQQQQLERLRYDNGALQRENSSLKNKLEVLNVQVSTYSEDFQGERADRERAQGAIQSLREENESLTQVINLLAREHGIRLDAYGIVPQQQQQQQQQQHE